MDAQMILGDKYLLAVVEDLSDQVLTVDRIAKKRHLPYPGVLGALTNWGPKGPWSMAWTG